MISRVVDDFRGFLQISRFSIGFVHRFERFQVANRIQKISVPCIFHGSEQFPVQNPWPFDACCKVLPGRGQKRSAHENPHFFAKCYLDVLKTRIFVDFCKVLIEDFQWFSLIFTNFNVIAYDLDRFQKANCVKMHSFPWILVDPSNFRIKIFKISALVPKCYRNVARSALGVKIIWFCKVLAWRAQTKNFRWFL